MRKVDGKRGEDIALAYLQRKGLKLRDRNWRCGHLEIDLIMEDDTFLHIIEVKSRTAPFQLAPGDSVVRQKQKRIIRATSTYIGRYNIVKEVSFDIVSIVYYERGSYKLEYIEGAFSPLYF